MARAGKLAGLYVAYVVLFLGGAAALGPDLDASALTPAEQASALPAALAMAAVDVALLGWWISHARSAGWRLWAEAFAVLYGVKTFSSQLETWWFVHEAHVPRELLPRLFAMTLPLALGWTALAVWAWGPRALEPRREPPPDPWRLLAAGTLLYPLWFFGFGYAVAWQSEAVRAYYGGPAEPLPLGSHLSQLFADDPLVVPFEMLRGLLWLAIGWPVIRGTRGPWWHGWALYALVMALVQNDVHWLPNPLMPAEVRWWHFWETSTSNLGFVLSSALLAGPGSRRRAGSA